LREEGKKGNEKGKKKMEKKEKYAGKHIDL